MKIKNALLAIAAVLAIASPGQTKAGPEELTGLGTIIVYRPWSFIGSAMKFNLNHGPYLTVRNGTYYRLTVLPGESTISHDNMPFPIDEDEQTVHVEAGQIVYFQCVIGLSLIFEVADDQERARADGSGAPTADRRDPPAPRPAATASTSLKPACSSATSRSGSGTATGSLRTPICATPS